MSCLILIDQMHQPVGQGYEKNAKDQRIENLDNATQGEKYPLSYDEYQLERKRLISGREEISSETETKQ